MQSTHHTGVQGAKTGNTMHNDRTNMNGSNRSNRSLGVGGGREGSKEDHDIWRDCSHHIIKRKQQARQEMSVLGKQSNLSGIHGTGAHFKLLSLPCGC